MLLKVSDYVMNFLVEKGVKDVFLVSGGNSMHLLDSLGNNKNLNYYCNHHEQASAMSAEGYARISKNFGVCLVSSGPAQTNALTGLMCAWEDSIPVMFISGNCNSYHLKGDTKLRQRGVHEVDILPMVKDVTKYAIRVVNPSTIRYDLEKAYYEMMDGRKGPVWIDIPVDIQASIVDEQCLPQFVKTPTIPEYFKPKIELLQKMIAESKRPVILIGGGAIPSIHKIIKWATKNNVPIVCTKNAYGYINANTPGYAGMIGINGYRGANFTIQNADLVLVLGSRLSLPSTGYQTQHFASTAKIIVVDADSTQIWNSSVSIDLSFNMGVIEFVNTILFSIYIVLSNDNWLNIVKHYIATDDFIRPINDKYVDAYNFYYALSHCLCEKSILVPDQGAAFYAWSQSFLVHNTISFTNGGFSPMGYGLPAAIGACIANDKKQTICVIGDGGFEMNIQELQTIVHYHLPIKIFVFNNNGYGSIRNTQDTYFNGHYVGSDPNSGVSCINPADAADAYTIDSANINNDTELSLLSWIIDQNGPMVIDVNLDPDQKILPKVLPIHEADGSTRSGTLTEMTPLLDTEFLTALQALTEE